MYKMEAPMTFEEARQMVRRFREERDWDQFHNSKDLAISISLEAAELLEVFQWSGGDLEAPGSWEHLCEELADVMIYCLHLADHLGVDPAQIIASKMRLNERKYPVEGARGSARKYTEL